VAVTDWKFEWIWLYRFVEVLSGESFFFECSHFDSLCFGEVLKAFAYQFPDERHIIQVDQSSVHQAARLEIPSSVELYFQPAYSPELNLMEQVWSQLKGEISNGLWWSLEQLRQELSYQLQYLTPGRLRSLMQREELVEALLGAGILRPRSSAEQELILL
jgi:hypothetical protein